MFLAPNFCGEGKNACFLPQTFAGKEKTRVSCSKLLRNEFTRVSCPKSSLARNLRAFLVPNPRWKEFTRVSCPKTSLGKNLRAYLVQKLRWERIYARILSQILAGKKFTRVSCPKTSLARNLRAYLVPKPRWQGIAVRFLLQNFAGKVSRCDSCSKTPLARYRSAILAPNLRWEGVAARFLPPGGGDMPPAAVETWRAASPSSYRAAAHIGRTRASRESASRGDVARRVSTSWTRKRRNPARPRGAAARERGRRSPAPPRRYRSILPPSEVTLATISSSPARLWSPGMVFLRALAERAKSRHRWLSSPHLPRACM